MGRGLRLCYEPSQQRYQALTAEGLRRAAELAEWRRKIRAQWNQVRIEGVEVSGGDPLHVGNDLEVTARVHLGAFQPDDVEVQIYHGPLDSMGEITSAQVEPMALSASPEGGTNGAATWTYRGRISCRNSGQYGFTVRVLPKHAGLPHVFETGLVTWGQ